jgi:ABC-type Fe3+ transport system substrate-binding protein
MSDERQRSSSIGRRAVLAGLAGAVGAATLAPRRSARAADIRLTVVGVETAATMAPLLAAIAANLPETEAGYRQAPPSRILSRLFAQTDEAEAVDVVLLPTPDLAVEIANEGGALRLDRIIARRRPAAAAHWRGEVFAIGYDPAVFVVRPGGLAAGDVPRSRTDLARMLEQGRARFAGRVGLTNIGIDAVAYGFAAQDALRSPLFWRISRAFGASEARIFDTGDELIAALSAGRIDFGYNVPLSAVRKAVAAGAAVEAVMPEDYGVALPWTALVPVRSRSGAAAGEVVDMLLSAAAAPALAAAGLTRPDDLKAMENVQPIELGPELLVHLDAMKRSRFLATWFQLVVQD